MPIEVIYGLMLPPIGTTLGSACVFLMRGRLNHSVERALSGFAAGVMVAASIWSLLIPAMEEAADLGRFAFLPAVVGLWAGVLFLLLLHAATPHQHVDDAVPEGPKTKFERLPLLIFTVTLHNIPEGMAVGVVFADSLSGGTTVSLAGALTLALGIAIQNFPEGAIISMPIHAEGTSKGRAFFDGMLSGAVEPAAALLTLLLTRHVVPLLPYLLSFAAGAMLSVVVRELVPDMGRDGRSSIGMLMFAAGFTLMMALDVALG